MTPARARESEAARMEDRGGMVTRTDGPVPLPHAESDAATRQQATARARSVLRRKAKRMLQENRSCECIDAPLATLGRTAHLANGAERRGRGVPFVDELHGETRPLRQLRGD